MNPWFAVGGAGLGLMQNSSDEKKAERDRTLAAQTALYSPWTGMKPNEVHEANGLGAMMSGASQGMALDQNMEKMNMDKQKAQRDADLNDAYIQYLNRMGQK